MTDTGRNLGTGAVLVALFLTAGIILTTGVASAVGRSSDKTIAAALTAKVDLLSAEVEGLTQRLGALEKALEKTKAQAAERVNALRAKLGANADELRQKLEAIRNAKPTVIQQTLGDKDCWRFGSFFDRDGRSWGDKDWDRGDWDGWDGDKDWHHGDRGDDHDRWDGD